MYVVPGAFYNGPGTIYDEPGLWLHMDPGPCTVMDRSLNHPQSLNQFACFLFNSPWFLKVFDSDCADIYLTNLRP